MSIELSSGRAGLRQRRRRLAAGSLVAVLSVLAAAPPNAAAHGPVAPVATSYLARIKSLPPGLEAKIVDGYVRIWLKVPRNQTVVVVDYVGAPYLRFTQNGVAINHNSSMYYLNQTPVAEAPPADLKRTTPPQWHMISDGHTYEWHDGRLQDLANQALLPDTSYVGQWQIKLIVDGQTAFITGALFHHARPSIIWFWPIVVLLVCVFAGWRLKRPELDRLIARGLGVAAIAGFSVAAVARGLHGRPGVPAGQVVELGVVLAFAAWALYRIVVDRPGYFPYFAIAFVALWEGFNTAGTLINHYVLLALPAAVSRAAAVACLGAGAAILLLVFRLAEAPRRAKAK